MESWVWENTREITALAAVLGVFIWQNLVGTQRAFSYHEKRLREISEDYRAREESQESRHRAEMRELLESSRQERKEDTAKFCESLNLIATRLGAVEQKIDNLTA